MEWWGQLGDVDERVAWWWVDREIWYRENFVFLFGKGMDHGCLGLILVM